MSMGMIRLAVTFVLVFAAPLSAITVAGHTAGQFQVNESGSANYSVPISVVPGTAGIEPQLALTYDSQGRNSLLGVGWSLSGLSVISRCPATVAQDGSFAPVDFDSNDRFCLDGERLMSIGGVYGANATEYRTEQNSFRQIISNGQAGSGPSSFTVRTKSGLTFEYGGTSNSRIEAEGKTSVLFWAVNKITDTKGNYLTVSYSEVDGEYWPTRIDYTGNTAANLTPYASVQFVYTSRTDVVPRFLHGSLLQVSKRMSTIRAYEGTQLYREYRLGYQTSESTQQSRLISLTECGSDGNCFAPTAFTWKAWVSTDFNFNGVGSGFWSGHAGGAANNFQGDFNGDGKTDIMRYATSPAGSWQVVLSTGSSFGGGGGVWTGHSGGPSNNFLGDFNGDGKSDIMGYVSGNTWKVALSTGNSFSGVGSGNWSGHSGGVDDNFLGDFNGDGKTDIAGYTGVSNLWHVTLSTGSNFNGVGSGQWAGHNEGERDTLIGDFNGDGRSDLLGNTNSQGQWKVGLSSGTSFSAPGSGTWIGLDVDGTEVVLGDFNGDGKTDLASHDSGDNWDVSLSDGTNFEAPGSGRWYGHSEGIYENFTGDFNGDGMTDIAAHLGGGSWDVCLSTGTNFQCEGWNGHGGGSSNNFPGDYNGDGKTDIMGYSSSGSWHVTLAGGPPVDVLTSIVDGHGLTTNVEYSMLTDPAVYTKDTGATYPEQDFQGPMLVVKSYSTSNGIGGLATYLYQYAGAKVNLQGRGFRGFGRTTITDQHTGIKSTIYYERDYRCISTKIRRTEERQPNGLLLQEVDNTIVVQDHGFGVNFSYVGTSIAKDFELDGNLVSVVTTSAVYDQPGNVLTLSVDYGEGLTETTVNSYEDDPGLWFLGRLTRSEVTKTAPGRPTLTRVSAFVYDVTSGLLTSEIIEPDNPALRLEKSYIHDAYGNIAVSTVAGQGFSSRSTNTVADGRGRFVQQSTNALGHTETKTYVLGNLSSREGPNQLITSWLYDGFGRPNRELRPDGTETLTTYEKCSTGCPEGSVYYVRQDITGAPYTIHYFDILDRVIREETQGFDGSPVYVDKKYNARGLLKMVSEPYFPWETPVWLDHHFDLLNRVDTETAPGERVTTYSYDGRIVTTTNPLGQISIRELDAKGQLIRSTDNLGSSVFYDYDAFGNLLEVTGPSSTLSVMTYDLRGNRTSIEDADTGTTTFVYNALGELASQTDAKMTTVSMVYDLLGRMVQRVEPEGTGLWTYDTRSGGIGKLSSVSRGDYQEDHFYDSLGRELEVRYTIGGTAFSLRKAYDAVGRPEVLTYPTGFGVRTVYNLYGYPQEIQRVSDNFRLWRANTVNAKGQLVQVGLGSSLVSTRTYDSDTGLLERVRAGVAQDLSFGYDVLGNLVNRQDNLRSLSESFQYDGLNRLVSSQVAGRPAVTLSYDSLGNITSKSDVGTYTYGENGAGPHAVTSIIGPKAGNYSYDPNGNMLQRQKLYLVGQLFADGFESGNTSAWGGPTGSPPPTSTTISYTSFNKPKQFVEGTTSLAFSYGPEYERYRQVVTTAGGSTTKIYVGGIFERETSGGVTRDLHYLKAGGETFALHTVTGPGPTTSQWTRFLLSDHLGSIQTITNEAGGIIEALSFDAWGLRRDAQTWMPASSVNASVDRGFTGHEHLDEVALIHMNGRVYDPVIGRFYSPDPFVQAPHNLQSFNRYAYVLNNPLTLIDPSGYFWGIGKFFKKILRSSIGRVAISIFAGYLTMGWGASIGQWIGGLIPATSGIEAALGAGFFSAVGSGAGFGFGSSFAGALLGGESVGDAIRFGLMGAVSGGLGAAGTALAPGGFSLSVDYFKRLAANGVLQGLSKVARGDKFEHGFLPAIFSRVFGPVKDTLEAQGVMGGLVATAVEGGTVAELGGGKFSNGAKTAAFLYSFRETAFAMRRAMVEQSKLTKANDGSGKSVGFWGDFFKLGGGRYDASCKEDCESLLGGIQGGPGFFLNISYDPGDTLDYLVEAYAGPHDFLNSGYWYDSMGNIDQTVATGFFSSGFGTLLNGVNVLVATPLVIPSMIPQGFLNDYYTK